MAQSDVLESQFVKILRGKVDDYFRGILTPPIPETDAPPRARAEFYVKYLTWYSFVTHLFMANNCTPQFWEKFGPEIEETWGTIRATIDQIFPKDHEAFVLGLLEDLDHQKDRHSPENWEIHLMETRRSLAALSLDLEKSGFSNMGQFNQLLDQWRKERQDAWEKEFHDNRTENVKRYDSPREIEETRNTKFRFKTPWFLKNKTEDQELKRVSKTFCANPYVRRVSYVGSYEKTCHKIQV